MNNTVYSYTYNTKIGYIRISANDKAVTRIDLNLTEKPCGETETPLIHSAYIQLCEYFDGKRHRFNLPLAPEGTDFQCSVWTELQKIPYGKTCSYRDIATAIGNKNACRAVGGANGANPIPVLIPCHRVIAADGKIGGYSGGLDIKNRLLEIEANNIHYFKYGKTETGYLKLRDESLAQVIDKIGILNYEIIPDIFTAMVNCIIGQQISIKALETIWQRIKENLGEITPASVNKTNPEDLIKAGISGRKASYIKDAAEKIMSGEFDIGLLNTLSDNEACKRLSSLRGVGTWTAEMILIFSMERGNVLSFDDFGIRRGICRLYGLESIDRGTFEYYRQLYSPYGTVASFYLWSVGNIK